MGINRKQVLTQGGLEEIEISDPLQLTYGYWIPTGAQTDTDGLDPSAFQIVISLEFYTGLFELINNDARGANYRAQLLEGGAADFGGVTIETPNEKSVAYYNGGNSIAADFANDQTGNTARLVIPKANNLVRIPETVDQINVYAIAGNQWLGTVAAS